MSAYARLDYESDDYDDTPDPCRADCCVVDQCCVKGCGAVIHEDANYYRDAEGYAWCQNCHEICWSCGDIIGATNDVTVSDDGRAHAICHILEGAQPIGRPA
jgi:hypothetical protein